MKITILLVICLVVYVRCATNKNYENSRQATILEHENSIGQGTYNFAFKTSDGSQRQEKAELKNPGGKDESIVVEGSYTFIGTDGNTYTINYIADENGYRASGNHLPKIETNA
ncbi:endocuticle structural glycoprotein SgAbd-5-like [Harmonia axyridis]|uniref:endocuticle structural glycoprotein SgAbd-5-like n=1 Tax=Harmonia axyridis TaxID=115357 RepID=UPI001E277D61|nr:endocuticle structural glycoprotein SgAbd-5-like [Harmonia axyridis]XP_045472423.1 endocuticle structural glycoprotein SgAbd-5-like [Harmonia axyridis]